MSKRQYAVHTVDSLMGRCRIDGDCWIWTGWHSGKTPYVDVNGRMTSVRKVLIGLLGRKERGPFYSCNCGNPSCVAPDHIVMRTQKEHSRVMSKRSAQVAGADRIIKITAARRARGTKLTPEQAHAIRLAEGTYQSIAEANGVSKSFVGQIKRGKVYKDRTNPFAGLLSANDSGRKRA